MENNKYVLGVCIPTFNRREIVKECVQRLLSFNLPIEVVVSDNCSPDGTFEELSKISDVRLKLFKQDHNVGASYNIHATFMKATASYAILISDEEDLDPDTLKYLIEYLNDKPDIGVFLGSGVVLNGKNKKYSNYEYATSEEALYNLGFNTRYGMGANENSFLSDNYWPTIFAQFGMVGTLLFCVLLFAYFNNMAKYILKGKTLESKLIFWFVTMDVLLSSIQSSYISHYSMVALIFITVICFQEPSSDQDNSNLHRKEKYGYRT